MEIQPEDDDDGEVQNIEMVLDERSGEMRMAAKQNKYWEATVIFIFTWKTLVLIWVMKYSHLLFF